MSKQIYKAAIYVRLSKDDGDLSDLSKRESNSISNQRDLIRDFLKTKNDIEIVDEYVDDGYSGISFNRPDFMRIIEDVNAGRINCIVVKDLSRFGRNYIEAGRYLEMLFPMMGVRFIAINDNYDSAVGGSASDSIIIPFKNLINDAYSRDISIKIRSHLDIKRRRGEFIAAFAVYGYKRDEADHSKVVIDEYAAGVVRDIFRWKLDGMSQQRIADKLNATGVLSPLEYKKSKGSGYCSGFQKNSECIWTLVAVTRILRNEAYLGKLIQGRFSSPNYKLRKYVEKPRKDWICIPDAFEPIIREDEFEVVQELLDRDLCIAAGRNEVYLFSGIAVCGDCGRQMTRKVSTVKGRRYPYYMCSANKKGQGCSGHRISEKKLIEAVRLPIQAFICEALDMKEQLEFAMDKSNFDFELKRLEERKEQLQKEQVKLQQLKTSLYEDFQDGLIQKEEYISIREQFEDRRLMVIEQYKALEEEANAASGKDGKALEWMERLVQYKDIGELSRRMLVELVSEIRIFEDKAIEITFRHQEDFAELKRYLEELKEAV